MYYTRAEYESLMLEAKVEFDEWERDKRKKKKASKVQHEALRRAKLEARKVFGE